jgi:L-ascorbate metabolism protein UlaG (beta-lactamase superfamily)
LGSGASALLLLLLLLGGCTLVGAPVPGAPAHHREHGFANPSGARGTDPFEFLVDRTRLAFAGPEESPAPALPLGQAALAWAAADGDAAQWLGHATLRLRLDGVVLLVDPVFADPVTPLPPFGPPRASPPPLGLAELDDVAAILISHDHYDHFEPETVAALAAATGARCLLPLRVAEGHDLGCAPEALDWGEAVAVAGLAVTLQPAQHESGRGLFDRDRSLWGAWLVEGGGKRVYVSGDGGYGEHFATLGAALGPIDLAVLSVGGYEPRTNRGVHMDPEEAIRALGDLRARRALIVHWGTYPLGLESGGETEERVRAAAEAAGLPPDAVVFLAIGEVLKL